MQESQGDNEQVIDSAWKPLFLTGGVAALLAVIFFRRNFGVELITFNGFGLFAVPETAPVSAIDWFVTR